MSYTADKMAETPFIPAEAVQQAREQGLDQAKNPVQRVGTAIKTFAGLFALMAFLAALYMLGVLVFGGRINYWQAFAVLIYASVPIIVIQKLISLILLYIKSPDDIHPIMGQETLVQDNLGILFSRPTSCVVLDRPPLPSLFTPCVNDRLALAGQRVPSGAGERPLTSVNNLFNLLTGIPILSRKQAEAGHVAQNRSFSFGTTFFMGF